MRRRIFWLVAATTSAVVLAFVVPLALLVRTAAAERAVSAGQEEARSMALVLPAADAGGAEEVVAAADRRSPARATVLLADGTVVGDARNDIQSDPRVSRALRGEAFTSEVDGATISYTPVLTVDGTSVIRITVTPEMKMDGVLRAWAALGLVGALLLGAALAISNRLGRRISEPVTHLAYVAQRLQDGELGARATAEGPEETVELAETLNRLADRIVELLAAERAAVGDLSHRLRTPVTALRLDSEAVDDDELAERLGHHIEQLQRTIDAIVRDARRPLEPTLTSTCDATAVVADRTAFWAALAEDQGRPMTVTLPPQPVVVDLEASALLDVLDVLLDNVFAHTPDDTAFSVRLSEDAEVVVLEVADCGPGRPTARPDEGPRPGSTGLGLHIVRRTAARAGGHLTVDDDGGFVARVTFPATTAHGSHR
jgi:signal transduction histidine kinase